MGRDSNFCCKTCEVNYYLGYGSYTTWLDQYNSIEEYRKIDSEYKDRWKNENFEKCLIEHEGHDFIVFSTDYTCIEEDNLMIEAWAYHDDILLIENYIKFKQINMED